MAHSEGMAKVRKRLRIRSLEPVKQAGLFAGPARVDGAMASHDHDFLEIVVVTGGRSVHRTLYGQRTIGRGDVLVIGPRQWHAYEGSLGLTVWNCGIGERLLKRELAWTAEDAVLGRVLWATSQTIGATGRGVLEGHLDGATMRGVIAPLEKIAASVNQTERVGWLLVFLGQVMPVLVGKGGKAKRPEPMHPAVRRVMEAMQRDAATSWSLERMTRIARVDRSYLVRLFGKHVGQSPMAMLLKMRCERAAAMLIETDEPVGRVGMAVGWADANYFGRRFRSHFGVTPSEFRAEHRGE